MEISGVKTIYDEKFLSIEHYNKYPQMLPWIGKYFGEKYKKILFIGESHYLPENSQVNIGEWYDLNKNNLNTEEIEYTNTRYCLLKNFNNNSIWKNINQILKNIGIQSTSNNLFEFFAFYNFFQRPAVNIGKEIFQNQKDIEIANILFVKIVDIIEPDFVLFLSSKSWDNCKNGDYSFKWDFTPHPSSPWWNRKAATYSISDDEILTGKEKCEILIKNSVFK